MDPNDPQVFIPANAFVAGAEFQRFFKRPAEAMGYTLCMAEATDVTRNKVIRSLYYLAPNEVDQGGNGLRFYRLDDPFRKIPSSLVNIEEPPLSQLVDIAANDSGGDAGKSLLPQWFERMKSTAQRTPLYSIKKEAGTVQQAPQQEEETPPDDGTNVDVLAKDMEKREKKKKKQQRIFGRSPAYGGLVLANGKPIVPYAADTVNSIGNPSGDPFTTTISFSAHEFIPGELRISFNICYGSTNVQYASAVIPLRDITNSPSTDVRELDQVAAYLDSLNIEHEVSSGAYTVQIVAEPTNTQVYFKEQALRDLEVLGMPYIQGLRQDISRVFASKKIRLTFLIPDGWSDFKSWVGRLCILRDHAHSDCLLPLKKLSGNQPINRKNVTLGIAEEIPFAPSLLAFDTVDQFITIQGDAIARENLYMEWLISFLSTLECQASLIPIGNRKIVIDRNGQKVSKPYIYALTIHDSTHFELLAQIIPPLGTKVLIQADVRYRALTRPVEDKTQEQIYLIIAHDIHDLIWNHRRPPTPKSERQQAWVDDNANLVKPYVHPDVWEKDSSVAEGTCYMIAHELRRKRGNRQRNEPGESAKDHKDRTIRFIQGLSGLLHIPPDNNAEVPQFPGARIAFDFPINTLGPFQFAVKSPRYPKWPRQDSITNPVPFLDWQQQKIPQTGSMAAMVSAARSLPKGQYVKCRIVNAYSDHTARSMEQGIYKLKEHQHKPIVKWFTDFKGSPITSDVSATFSILNRVMWKLFFEPALPFQGYDIDSLDPLYVDDMDGIHAHLYPEEISDENGEVMEFTTKEFQEREATVTKYLLGAFRGLTPTQLEVVKLLPRTPFATLIMEGVPGSGKTRIAKYIFAACLHSAFDPKLRPHQDIMEEDDPWVLGDQQDDAESDPGVLPEDSIDAGVDFNLKPELMDVVKPESKETPEHNTTEQPASPAPDQTQWLNIFQFMPLTFGPDKRQMETIISKSANLSLQEVFGLVFDVYTENFTEYKKSIFRKMSSLDWRRKTAIGNRLDRRHVFHYQDWLSRVCEVIRAEDDIDIPHPQPEPERKAPTMDEAIEIQKKRLGLETEQAPRPKPQQVGLQGMIIANQNVNGDDLAGDIHDHHLEELGFDITVIRVTNLDAERDALIQSFRPERDDYLEDAPSLADILDDGIDDRVKDFAENIGDFEKRKYGGVFKLEVLMRGLLRANKKPNLKRQLQRLQNPADRLTKEEMKQLKKSVDELIKEILECAHVVVCTFVVAQSLHFKKMFRPEVVWIDEASRENECLIRWAQLALAPALLILTGDSEQDKPFCGTINVRPDDDNNIIARRTNYFKDQYMMPFSKRVKEKARHHMAYLTENFRQRGGLQNLSSEIFYEGLMQSGLDPNARDDTTDMWYKYAQDLVRENRSKRPQQKEEAAEFLTYNRLTYVCRSTRTTVGMSSVDTTQARLAVDWAAAIHQAGVPGLDGRRPTICIITPYAAQVEEIRRCLNQVSNQEICKELVEIRTQTNATGGEWDVVINVFVRDDTMGFLADGYRLNVMWTRARFFNLDILNIDFFAKPKGRGASIMRAYRREVLRNGALLSDKRDWTFICHRCFRTHSKGCTEDIKCTFCGGPHHARKCTSEDVMAPAIPEGKRFAPKYVVEDRRPAGEVITDFIEQESESEKEERDQEEAQAREPDMDSVLAVRNYIAELGAAPLDFERPEPVQVIQEDNIYDATDNEDNVGGQEDSDDNDGAQDAPKIKFKPRKGKAVELDAKEKKQWTEINKVHIPAWESEDPQGANTEATGDSSPGNTGWQNNTGNANEWEPKPGDDSNTWDEKGDTSNNCW